MKTCLLRFVLFVATTSVILKECSAIWCYSCSYTRSADPKLTYECVDQPDNVTTGSTAINCSTFCNTQRRYTGGIGLMSFSRGCAPPSESKRNKCTGDVHGSTCFTSCDSSDRCNGGTGIPPGYNEKGERQTSGGNRKVNGGGDTSGINPMRMNSKFLIILVFTISCSVF